MAVLYGGEREVVHPTSSALPLSSNDSIKRTIASIISRSTVVSKQGSAMDDDLSKNGYTIDDKAASHHIELQRTGSASTGDAHNRAEHIKSKYPAVHALGAEELRAHERALVRKIDFRLLPMVVLMYMYVSGAITQIISYKRLILSV